jgi:succinylglutamic semialdehyde dehydrogenase
MNVNELHPEQHFIDGQWRKGEGDPFYSINPATGSKLWIGRNATAPEVNSAVNAARDAYKLWSLKSFNERADILQTFAQVVSNNKERLAQVISMENGKPYWEALTEASTVIGKVKLSISAYQERTSNQHFDGAAGDTWLRYKPHGVVAVLGAFNFPAHLSNGHIVPALLAGNTVVLKPSELTPAVSQLIIDFWQQAGLPNGVINCIQGNASTGQLLLDQTIDGVYFTGSYTTGKRIHQHFSGQPNIILALEMGGNNPLIIDNVSNINAAVYNTMLSSFISSGQRCTCARRVMIPDNDFGQSFINALITATRKIKVDTWDAKPEPFMGPVIRAAHAKRHIEAQQALMNSGGEALLEMTQLHSDSALLSPGIIDMSSANALKDEEIFAPLVQIFRYKDFEHAIALANQTDYGLSAGVLTDSSEHYKQFYAHIRAGIVNWNKPTTGAAGNMPFGGIGNSGNHRPSAYFAADYCAYPVASVEQKSLSTPETTMPGITLD